MIAAGTGHNWKISIYNLNYASNCNLFLLLLYLHRRDFTMKDTKIMQGIKNLPETQRHRERKETVSVIIHCKYTRKP